MLPRCPAGGGNGLFLVKLSAYVHITRCSVPCRHPFFQDAKVTLMLSLCVIENKKVDFKTELFFFFLQPFKDLWRLFCMREWRAMSSTLNVPI